MQGKPHGHCQSLSSLPSLGHGSFLTSLHPVGQYPLSMFHLKFHLLTLYSTPLRKTPSGNGVATNQIHASLSQLSPGVPISQMRILRLGELQ